MNLRTIPLPARFRPTYSLLKVITLCFVLIPFFGFSQVTSDVDPSLQSTDKNLAPVKFEGKVLFYVRGVSAFPADERAITISRRIRKAAADDSISPDSVKVIPDQDKMQIYAGKAFIMNVYPVDAEVDGINVNVLGEVIKIKIISVINTYRHERSPAVITSSIWHAIAGLLLTIGAIFLFRWLFRRLKDFIKSRINTKADVIEKVTFKLIRPDQLINSLRVWYRMARTIIIVVIIVVGINYILSLFPWTKAAAIYILQLFLDPLQQAGNGILNYLPKLFFLVVIVLLTRFILNLLKLFFNGLQNGVIVVHNFYQDWAMPAYQIIRFLIVVLSVVMAFPYIPFSDTGAFQGISVFLGLLLSLGSSSFVSNIIAGYSLTFRRAFQIGDRILVNDSLGTVEHQSLMVTRLRSVKNEEIVIPNSVLINSTVLNYTKEAMNPGIILHSNVGIGYETPWRQVDSMLRLAAERTEGLLKDPAPFVLKRALGDYAVNYEINVYCNDPSKILHYYNLLHQNILDVFNEYDVQIMTPSYVADPQQPKVVPKENWNIPPANEKTKTENPG
jgi:small-conductance mechanosensitive channel